jgi:exodeoxyribonuclease VII large subunit
VLIYPVPVQGAGAAQRIAQALALAGERAECDVLILARGGGSLEDLWPFNEEVVARAIHACPIPVVTGIGHEVDFTIADFVADLRAPTPSAAAAAVSPDQAEWRGRVNGLAARLGYLLGDRLQRHRQRLGWLTRGLRHPQRRLLDLAQRLDGLALRLARAQRGLLAARALRLQQAATRLHRAEPRVRLARAAGRLGALEQRLAGAWRQGLDSRRARLATLGRGLEAVSPMATLGRGYAILTRAADGVLVRCVSQIRAGDRLSARVTDGSIPCTVEARDTGPTPAGSG